MATFYDNIYDYISELEVVNEIRLSDEAKQLLILPLIEYQKIINRPSNREINTYQELSKWRESLTRIVQSLKNSPARIDNLISYELRQNERTSLSVVKAFADNFCNIPPICGEDKK